MLIVTDPPLTATVTDRLCVVVMLDADGVTVAVGVSVPGAAVLPPPCLSSGGAHEQNADFLHHFSSKAAAVHSSD